MKFILLATVFLAISCNVKEHFSESSKITPIAEAKTFADKLGDGEYITKTIYMPMTSASIHHYDYDAIIDREDVRNQTGLSSLMEGLKVGFLNLGMSLISKNKVKISTEFDFGFIDTEIIKEVKIKNVFFNIKGCNEKLETCQARRDEKDLSVDFLKEIFINFSAIDRPVLGDEIDINMDVENFSHHSKMAFRPNLINAETLSKNLGGYGLVKDFTIAKYKYSQRDKDYNDSSDVIILRAEQDYLFDIKHLLKSQEYQDEVELVELIGDNIYVKLHDASKANKMLFKLRKDTFFTDGRILSIINCDKKKCINFDVNESNLIPMIDKSSRVQVDTYLSLNRITKTDFEYQGLIELEIKVYMP